jgi:predicted hydrocarbon binding protein
VTLPTASELPAVRYSNKIVRLLLQSLEEVLGRSGLNAVLNLAQMRRLVDHTPPNNLETAFTPAEVGTLLCALDEMYGPRAGRGLALRTGRAAFRYGLKEFGQAWNLTDLSFRLQPLGIKLKAAAEACAGVVNQQIGLGVVLTEANGRLVWTMPACPECAGRRSAAPCCYVAVGLLQESAYWSSGGKNFEVEETTCVALGDPLCTLVMDKRPLD